MRRFGKAITAITTALSLLLSCPAVLFAEEAVPAALSEEADAQEAVLNSGTDTSSLVRIGDTVFNITEEAGSWQGSSGWKNDTANKYIVFVNFNGEDTALTTGRVEVTLAMSGLNRLAAISAGDTVNIVGTGILLVDKIEMAEGAVLNLQPDVKFYSSGSVAVFLKQADGTYLMINGSSVPGILDESYTLPANTSLVIPSGSRLDLPVILSKTELYYSDAGEEVTETKYYVNSTEGFNNSGSHGGDVTTEATMAQLMIPASSSLTVGDNAAVTLNKIDLSGKKYSSKLTMEGTLSLSGNMKGGIIDIQNGGILKGGGVIKNADVNLNMTADTSDRITYTDSILYVTGLSSGKKVNPILDGSRLIMKCGGADIGTGTVSGDSAIAFKNGTSVDSMAIAADGTLVFHPMDVLTEDVTLTLNGAIRGGTVVFAGGRVVLGEKASVASTFGNADEEDVYDAIIFDGTGALPASDFPAVLTAEKAAERLAASPETVDTVYAQMIETRLLTQDYSYSFKKETSGKVGSGVERGGNNSASANSIMTAAGYKESEFPYCFVEAFKVDSKGNLSVQIFREGGSVDLTSVFLLRVMTVLSVADGTGGSATTSTNTSFTGTGVLGNNTGSLTAGAATVVYRGTGRSEPDFSNGKEDDNSGSGDDDNGSGNNSGSGSSGDSGSGSGSTGNTGSSSSGNSRSGSSSTGNTSRRTGRSTSSGTSSSALEEADSSTAGQGTSQTDTVSESETGKEMRVVVTAGENGLYTLAVYQNGKKLSSLNGSDVAVEVTDPEGISGDDVCYAVFDRNGTNIWIPASYDIDKKVLAFESDQVGTFKIVRVSVEDSELRAEDTGSPVYRKLRVMIGNEEVSDLTHSVNVAVPMAEDREVESGLYAVFVDENEELQVFPVTCDERNRLYLFETGVTGNFVIVRLGDDYRPGSDELHKACRASEEVRVLVAVMRLYTFWS